MNAEQPSQTAEISQPAAIPSSEQPAINAPQTDNYGQAVPPPPPAAGQYGTGQPQPQQPQQPEPSRMPPSNLGRDSGKMFIGGLNWDTTEDGLVSYFSKYGEIADYTIMKDPNTGRSRGFGFLTFRDPRAVDEVIRKDHILDGKLIDPKRAIAREEQDKVGKIFVGGIDPLVNEKDFNDFFSQFGRIIDAQLMIDKDTGRSRGFGFITFDTPDAVDRVCVNKYLTLKGKAMEVKRAEPRGQHQLNHNQGYHQQQQQPPQQQQQQFNPYNTYGQFPMQMPGGNNMPNFQGASPEMMQEYWQRMQWYMFQQQQAAQGEGNQQDQPHQQPLNPQQQGAEDNEGDYELNDTGRYESDNSGRDSGRESGGRNGGGRDNGRGRRPSDRTPPSGPSGDNGGRRNLPKGPKRAPPSGPSSGRSRGGYKRGGYHPYGKKGRK